MKTWRAVLINRWLVTVLILGAVILPTSSQSAVTGTVGLNINLADIRTIGGDSVTAPISKSFLRSITNGTGANQVNLCWADQRQVTTGGSDALDFSGSLVNAYGTAVFTKVKYFSVEALPANTTNLTVTATSLLILAGAGDATPPLKPGSFFAISDLSAAGITVTNTTADVVTITNSAGATATYNIVVCGLS